MAYSPHEVLPILNEHNAALTVISVVELAKMRHDLSEICNLELEEVRKRTDLPRNHRTRRLDVEIRMSGRKGELQHRALIIKSAIQFIKLIPEPHSGRCTKKTYRLRYTRRELLGELPVGEARRELLRGDVRRALLVRRLIWQCEQQSQIRRRKPENERINLPSALHASRSLRSSPPVHRVPSEHAEFSRWSTSSRT